ncbi:MAG: sugar phosphate isomerase/epimerase, partial [Oscillospiraceae bacterium]|nr:sugar phosphate isomerase/epimerase [Oscillospiraceae bacterium]
MLDKSRITAAIWPWGTSTRDEMVQAAIDVTDIGYRSFESVKAAIYAYDLDLKAYKEVLERYNLKPVSFYFHLPPVGGEEEIFNSLDKELEFIAALGVDRICLQATGGHPGKLDESQLEFELNLVEKFARKTKSYGVTSNLHNHHNTWVMFENEIENILDNLGPDVISFAPDTAHLVGGLCDPVKVIRKYADRVNFIHLKDIATTFVESEGIAPAGMEVYSNFCELGKGLVDFRQVFDILKAAGYNGPLCEELDRAPVS